MSKEELKILNEQRVLLESMRKFIATHPTTLSSVFKLDMGKSLNESITEIDVEIERMESEK